MMHIRHEYGIAVETASVDIKALSLLPRAAEAAVNEGMSIRTACFWLSVMMQILADKKDETNDE